MSSIKAIPDILLAVLPGKVHHFSAHKAEYPYIIWAEENPSDTLGGDDTHAERSISGSIRYYTQTEYDGTVDDILEALDTGGISAALSQISYNEATDVIEYLWDWSIPCGDGKIY